MADVGNILREARIRNGLTIKDVENVTKIRGRYLEALENDDYAMMPGPTFVAAFLRTYARYLKLDPESLVEEYRRGLEPRREEPSVLRVGPAQPSRSRTVAEKQKRRHHRNQRGYAFVGVLAIAVVVVLAWLGPGLVRQSPPPATLSSQSIPTLESTTTSLGNVSSTTTVAKASTTTSASVLVAGGNVTLQLTVTDKSCWMVVREDGPNGAELYAGTLSAGGQKTFDSSKRYWMMVGNPQVLSLTVNDRELKLDSTAGSFTVTEAGVQADQ